MVMQAIRRSKKKMRIPLIIMVIVLAVGLIGSFAIWSSPDMQSNAPGNEANPEEQIKNLQVSIDSMENELKEKPKDYSIIKSLADVRYQQAGFYAQINDKAKSEEVFAKGLENYLAALDYAPTELNAQGQADIMVKAAYCASNSGQDNTAGVLYQQAIELVPEDFAARYNYVLFLAFYLQDLNKAKEEIGRYKAILKDGDERIAQADQLLAVIETLAKETQDQEQTDQSNTTGQTDTTGKDSGTDDKTEE
ncbi:MAG TPA: hypothetical protein VN462_11250 [Negativicutes bacterium]|nr:hypothetical protein [Negativicutes bacterium]